MVLYYFDDEEEGLARETSHPFFVEHATADFYYDLADEFSPFGNDAGADTLFNLEDWYKERRAGEKAVTFIKQQIGTWDIDIDYWAITDAAQLDIIEHDSQLLYSEIDKIIIAVAFGQFKIAGKSDKAMASVAEAAFFRQRHVAERARVRRPEPWDYAEEYLAKLRIMKSDLITMTNKKAR
jgi:uncharacterized protein YfeS